MLKKEKSVPCPQNLPGFVGFTKPGTVVFFPPLPEVQFSVGLGHEAPLASPPPRDEVGSPQTSSWGLAVAPSPLSPVCGMEGCRVPDGPLAQGPR